MGRNGDRSEGGQQNVRDNDESTEQYANKNSDHSPPAQPFSISKLTSFSFILS